MIKRNHEKHEAHEKERHVSFSGAMGIKDANAGLMRHVVMQKTDSLM